MRVLPPFDRPTQFNEQSYDDYVPEFVDPTTEEPLPAASYRLRWNTRTESWECGWLDENGDTVDQGRRLSTNWWLRTPWGDENYPTPMAGWIAFLEDGETGAEADFEALGRTHLLIEYNNEDIEDIEDSVPSLYPFPVTITTP
jgi:hypothetical protein